MIDLSPLTDEDLKSELELREKNTTNLCIDSIASGLENFKRLLVISRCRHKVARGRVKDCPCCQYQELVHSFDSFKSSLSAVNADV